jgi:hypothetical protein
LLSIEGIGAVRTIRRGPVRHDDTTAFAGFGISAGALAISGIIGAAEQSLLALIPAGVSLLGMMGFRRLRKRRPFSTSGKLLAGRIELPNQAFKLDETARFIAVCPWNDEEGREQLVDYEGAVWVKGSDMGFVALDLGPMGLMEARGIAHSLNAALDELRHPPLYR